MQIELSLKLCGVVCKQSSKTEIQLTTVEQRLVNGLGPVQFVLGT